MKWKTALTIIFVLITIFIIYLVNKDNKVFYFNIIDQQYDDKDNYYEYLKQHFEKQNKLEKFIPNYHDDDYRITDLIRDIEDNKKIYKDQTIQNAFIKADILTLKIGNNELNYKIETSDLNELFDYCDEVIKDLDKLFKVIRDYCKEEIYFIGYYNEHGDKFEELYSYLNLKIEDIANHYNISFIPLNQEFNRQEQEKIYQKIIKISKLS